MADAVAPLQKMEWAGERHNFASPPSIDLNACRNVSYRDFGYREARSLKRKSSEIVL